MLGKKNTIRELSHQLTKSMFFFPSVKYILTKKTANWLHSFLLYIFFCIFAIYLLLFSHFAEYRMMEYEGGSRTPQYKMALKRVLSEWVC